MFCPVLLISPLQLCLPLVVWRGTAHNDQQLCLPQVIWRGTACNDPQLDCCSVWFPCPLMCMTTLSTWMLITKCSCDHKQTCLLSSVIPNTTTHFCVPDIIFTLFDIGNQIIIGHPRCLVKRKYIKIIFVAGLSLVCLPLRFQPNFLETWVNTAN